MTSISSFLIMKVTLLFLLLSIAPTQTQSYSFLSNFLSSLKGSKNPPFSIFQGNNNEKVSFENISNKRSLRAEIADSNLPNPFLERDFISIFFRNNFFGTWETPNKDDKLFHGFFRNNKGLIVLEATDTGLGQVRNTFSQISSVLNNKTFLSSSTQKRKMILPKIWSLLIKLYDGNYVDQRSASIFYEVSPDTPLIFNSENATFSSEQGMIEIFLKDDLNTAFFFKKCPSEFSLHLIDVETLQSYRRLEVDLSSIGVQYQLKSIECDLELSTEILTIEEFRNENEINIYVFMVSALALIKMTGAYQVKHQLRNRKAAFRISVGSVWLMATVDYYILIINLVLAFAHSFIFLIPFCLYMFHAFFLERDIILRILQARTKRYGPDITDESCKSCGFYFALSTILFFCELIFIMMAKFWIIHLTALVFIPQIYDNAKRDKPYHFNFYHIFLMGSSHIVFIAYMKLYAHNIFRLSPDISFVTTYAAIIAIQIMILLIQMINPRGCFPCFWRKRRIRSTVDDDTCPICMGELKRDFITNGDSLLDYRQVVETPCTHVFHVQCLKKWMANKVECPICREEIEEIYEEVASSEDDGSQAQLQL